MVVFDPGPEGSRPSAVGGVLFGDCQWFQAFFGGLKSPKFGECSHFYYTH